MEFQRDLAHRFDASAMHHRQRGRERHVGVQHAFCIRLAAVRGAVNEKRRRLHLKFPGNLAALAIHHHQIGRRNFRPVQTLRVDQKMTRPVRHFDAEMIADALAETHARSTAQGGGEIDARLRFRCNGFGHCG